MGIPSSPKQASPPAGDLERGDERTPLLARYMSNEDTCVAETQGVAAAAKDSSFTDALKDETVVEAWWTEARVMASSSSNMAVTFFLQYSINFMSVFAAGRLGKVELGAVALANMTTGVTCLAPFLGLATALDTLCPQAFGDGRKHLVGLHCQRLTLLLFTCAIPVSIFWYMSEPLFASLLGNGETARLTCLYLRVMILSLPGTIVYETGKRMLQAQGMFRQTSYVLFITAPLNLIANWLLVWKLELGYIGAPLAVAFSRNLLALLLVLYIRYVNGSQCWGGFDKRAMTNWGPMVWLALPGMTMVLAEWGAFEIMTFLASRFGTDYLAAQSILGSSAAISFQIPFAMSVATSTRIANLIGAGLVDRAKLAARIAIIAFWLVSMVICALYISLRYYIPWVFTSESEVIELAARVMPIVGAMQLVDVVATGMNGLLRGVGKQSIGGPTNVFAYYVVSLPLSLWLMTSFGWKLEALWTGVTVALFLVIVIEGAFLLRVDWDAASAEAKKRNEAN